MCKKNSIDDKLYVPTTQVVWDTKYYCTIDNRYYSAIPMNVAIQDRHTGKWILIKDNNKDEYFKSWRSQVALNAMDASKVHFTSSKHRTYYDIDKAAMDAATMVYNKSKEGGWVLEYGMAIFGNNTKFRDSRVFRLGEIRTGERVNGSSTEHSISMKKDMENPISGYYFNGFVHSHPASPPIVCYYEFSAADYYNANSYYYNSYLVLNLGNDGLLINFMPPPQFTDKRQYNDAMGTLYEEKSKRLPIRSIYVKAVDSLISEFKGKLQETPIRDVPMDDNIRWNKLSPSAILWKSGATTLTIKKEGQRVTPNGRGGVMYDSRSSMYNLKETITTVTIEDGVDDIAHEEFIDFIALTNVTVLGSNLLRISDGAFSGCKKLESITTRNSNLKGIGAYAFAGCKNLKSITLQSRNLETIGECAFYGCERLASIIIPSRNLKTIGKRAFYGCERLTSIIIPDSNLTKIHDYTFYGCTNLKSIEIQSSNLSTIGAGAFFNCENLTHISIQSRELTTIEARAFFGCRNLASITCMSTKLPAMVHNTFEGLTQEIILRVPQDRIGAYERDPWWRTFKIRPC